MEQESSLVSYAFCVLFQAKLELWTKMLYKINRHLLKSFDSFVPKPLNCQLSCVLLGMLAIHGNVKSVKCNLGNSV